MKCECTKLDGYMGFCDTKTEHTIWCGVGASGEASMSIRDSRPFATRIYKKMTKQKSAKMRKRLEKKGVRMVRKYYDHCGKLRVHLGSLMRK